MVERADHAGERTGAVPSRAPDSVVALGRDGTGDEDAAERPAASRPGGRGGEGRGTSRRCHGARRMRGTADEEGRDEHAGEAHVRKPR